MGLRCGGSFAPRPQGQGTCGRGGQEHARRGFVGTANACEGAEGSPTVGGRGRPRAAADFWDVIRTHFMTCGSQLARVHEWANEGPRTGVDRPLIHQLHPRQEGCWSCWSTCQGPLVGCRSGRNDIRGCCSGAALQCMTNPAMANCPPRPRASEFSPLVSAVLSPGGSPLGEFQLGLLPCRYLLPFTM